MPAKAITKNRNAAPELFGFKSVIPVVVELRLNTAEIVKRRLPQINAPLHPTSIDADIMPVMGAAAQVEVF